MDQARRPDSAHAATFVKTLADELVNHHRMPRRVVRQLRRECLVELVAAFRSHRDCEMNELMRAPKGR